MRICSILGSIIVILCTVAILCGSLVASLQDYLNAKSIYEFKALDIYENEISLEKYKGHVCIIVNVASECGLTDSNYDQLKELYQKYGESKGLKILAFPSNEFGSQEPGTNEDILNFAKYKGIKFDLFSKIEVNGDNAHPLWQYLKDKQGGYLGDSIKWNFTKFIVDKNGQVVERFAPTTQPKDMADYLEKYFKNEADYKENKAEL